LIPCEVNMKALTTLVFHRVVTVYIKSGTLKIVFKYVGGWFTCG